MAANFLKYLTVRLALAFFIFIIASYTSMYILYEQVGGERYNSFFWFLMAILSLLIPSVVLSYIGKLRFNGFLIKAGEYDLSLNSRQAVKRFERLLSFAYSFYFLPTTTEKLLKQIYREYSKIFLGLHAISRAAQEVYEEAILRHPGDSNLQNILLDIYSEKESLSKNELEICLHIFRNSTDNRKTIEILSKHYIKNNIFDFNSQEIFAKAIKLNTSTKEKAVDFLILKLIELQREDDFAAEVYLAAYSEYSNKSEPVIEAIIKLALDRKKKWSTEWPGPQPTGLPPVAQQKLCQKNTVLQACSMDDLSQKICRIYEEIPGKTRNLVEERFLKTRQEKPPALISKKKFFKELISGVSLKILDVIQTGKISLKAGILKFQVFKVFGVSLIKKPSFAVFSGLSAIVVLLVIIMALQGEKKTKPSLNLLNINPQYTIYESKLPYSIQVAAFKTLEKAEQVINDLSKNGEIAYYTNTGEKSTWYRVRVGEFKTKKEAKRHAGKLLKSKLIKGYFISNFEPGFIKLGHR